MHPLAEPGRGVVQIAHGLGERSGRYSEPITVLQEVNGLQRK